MAPRDPDQMATTGPAGTATDGRQHTVADTVAGSLIDRRAVDVDWQSHPSVNSPVACSQCGAAAVHAQHCKRMCLACGWLQSCVD